jgi:hypothetical protein
MQDNVRVIQALVENVPPSQADWSPSPETWSLCKVLEHLVNEERIDFRLHLREMFHQPPVGWGGFPNEQYAAIKTASLRAGLERFLDERAESLGWLQGLGKPDWSLSSQAAFGPDEVLTLSAGDVMLSWVAHDYLHIRQINELLYGWNERSGAPYSVRYAGGWG